MGKKVPLIFGKRAINIWSGNAPAHQAPPGMPLESISIQTN